MSQYVVSALLWLCAHGRLPCLVAAALCRLAQGNLPYRSPLDPDTMSDSEVGSSSSSDKECVGAGQAPSKQAATRSRRAAASTASVKAASSAAASAADSEQNAVCYVCESAGAECTQVYRGHKIHGNCMNAIRSHNRIIAGNRDLQVEVEEFHSRVAEWRKRIVPLVVQPGARRTPAQRQNAKASSQAAYTSQEVFRDNMRLPMVRFMSYRMFWDNLSRAEARAAWEEALSEQGDPMEDSDGEPTVLVKGIKIERSLQGKRQTTTTTTSNSAGGGDGDADFRPDGPTSARKRCAPSEAGDIDDDDGGDFRTPPPKQAKKASGGSRAVASLCEVQPHEIDPSAASSQKFLLQMRSDLQKSIKAAVEQHAGSKSHYALLKKSVDKANLDDLGTLTMDPSTVLRALLKDLIEPLREMERGMNNMHLRDVLQKKVVRSPPPHNLS